jgi:drug/metabolite transporter (DMT)-like permease
MALMAASAAGWVVLEAVIGARLERAYPLMQVVWCRYAAHLLILVVLFGWVRPSRLWRTSRPGFQFARSMLMVLMPASFVLGLFAAVPPVTIWAVFWSCPLIALLFARRFLAERVPVVAWWACGAGLVGALASIPNPHGPSPIQLVPPLIMGASLAGYVVMTRVLRSEPVVANLFYTAAGAFVVLTPLTVAHWVTPTLRDAVLLAGIGAVGLLSLLALDRATARAPVSVVVPMMFVQLPVLLLVHALIDGTFPSRATAAGVLLACAGVVVAWVRSPVPGLGATDAPKRSRA